MPVTDQVALPLALPRAARPLQREPQEELILFVALAQEDKAVEAMEASWRWRCSLDVEDIADNSGVCGRLRACVRAPENDGRAAIWDA